LQSHPTVQNNSCEDPLSVRSTASPLQDCEVEHMQAESGDAMPPAEVTCSTAITEKSRHLEIAEEIDLQFQELDQRIRREHSNLKLECEGLLKTSLANVTSMIQSSTDCAHVQAELLRDLNGRVTRMEQHIEKLKGLDDTQLHVEDYALTRSTPGQDCSYHEPIDNHGHAGEPEQVRPSDLSSLEGLTSASQTEPVRSHFHRQCGKERWCM